jgi:hypothetical protein
VYSFTVAGSVGGSCAECDNGPGAGYSFTAQMALDQGETLQFVVGQTPTTGSYEAGGGGATFVLSSNGQSAMFIAGGGGGPGYLPDAGRPALGLSASQPVGGSGGMGSGVGSTDGSPGLPGQGGAGGSANGEDASVNGGGGGGGGTLGEASVSWSLVSREGAF